MGLATHPIARLSNVCVCVRVYVYECGVCLHLSERIQFGKKSTSPPLKKEHTFCSNKNFFIRLEIRNVNLCVCVCFFLPLMRMLDMWRRGRCHVRFVFG